MTRAQLVAPAVESGCMVIVAIILCTCPSVLSFQFKYGMTDSYTSCYSSHGGVGNGWIAGGYDGG